MKRIILSIACLALSLSLSAQEYVEPWKAGYLDIHAISTGLGEAGCM